MQILTVFISATGMWFRLFPCYHRHTLNEHLVLWLALLHSPTLQQQKQLHPFHKMHYHDPSIVLMLSIRWSYELQFLLFYYCQISLHLCRFQRYFVLPFGITYLTSIMKVESSLCFYKLDCTDFCIYFHTDENSFLVFKDE